MADADLDAYALAADLRVAIRRLTARLRAESVEHELSPSKRAVIAQLDALGPSTIVTLARAEAVRPQSMGATVAAVEAEGLVERSPDPKDGRRVVISLTEAGRHALAESRALRQEWLGQTMGDSLSQPELATIRDAVGILERLAGP